MRPYLQRLREHPGLGLAAAFSLLGAIAGGGRGGPRGALVGGLIMSVFWIPVFLTARKL